MQRHSSQAARLLTAVQQGVAPDRRVEQLHLLQLFLRLHRQAYERTGEEPSAVLSKLWKERGSADINKGMQRRLRSLQGVYGLLYEQLAQAHTHSRMELRAVAAADAATSTAAWHLFCGRSSLLRTHVLVQSPQKRDGVLDACRGPGDGP